MSIIQENVTINDRQFIRTYSDRSMKIERQDGVRYDDAYDPVGSGRTYTETDEPIEGEESAEETLSLLEAAL